MGIPVAGVTLLGPSVLYPPNPPVGLVVKFDNSRPSQSTGTEMMFAPVGLLSRKYTALGGLAKQRAARARTIASFMVSCCLLELVLVYDGDCALNYFSSTDLYTTLGE